MDAKGKEGLGKFLGQAYRQYVELAAKGIMNYAFSGEESQGDQIADQPQEKEGRPDTEKNTPPRH